MQYLRQLGAALALCAAALLPAAAQAQGALGANYNEQFADLDYRDLERSNTKWLRMFVPMPATDRGGPAQHGVVKTILDASGRGYKTILTLKFTYVGSPIPQLGSDAYAKDVARLDKLLPLVMGKVDMLVIGGEPFFEAKPEDRNANFNAYYEGLAKRAIDYRDGNCASDCKTRLYMGALSKLEVAAERTKITDRWLEYVRLTPGIDGVAIHTHIDDVDTSKAYLKYILPRMRPEQKFLVTDFSLVKWWEQNMRGSIPAAFADKYSAPRTAQNWSIIKAALETPFSKAQWDEFLSQSPWFESRKRFLATQMKLFRDTGRLAVATYGFAQGNASPVNISPGAAAWQLNGLVGRRTIKRNPDGTNNFTYGLIDDYRALQTQ